MFALEGNCYNNKDFRIYNTAIYVRLSREDESAGESESITNQKDYLTKIVIDQGWNLIDIYADDGFSGTNFNRPDFKRLIKDIETKRINLVITKDLSRLGRDYIETGHYLERYFPEHNVRYIALNDGIDTFSNSSNNDMSPFKSVINDMYAKDISKKVRTAKNTKRENGKFIGSFAPYGYMKDPNDRNKLIIDNETSPVVKKIYEMYLNGNGLKATALALNQESIPCPSIYKSSKEAAFKNGKLKVGLWSLDTVKKILINPTYAGNLTQNKLSKLNYKSKKQITIAKKDWITVEDTHQPIIEKNTFDLVQQMIEKKASSQFTKNKVEHLLAGLIFCGKCGERMTFTKSPKGYIYIVCSKYKRFKSCSRHSILEDVLEDYILDDLKKLSVYAVDQEKILSTIDSSKLMNDKLENEDNEITSIEVKLLEIKKSIKILYSDKLKGILAEEDFIELSKEFNKQREQFKYRLSKLTEEKQLKQQNGKGIESFINVIKDFINLEKIDKPLLVKLTSKIEVFEDKKIAIHYNFRNPF